ncbi:MAG: phosphate ABC transporter permease PstA [Lentisphaerota bacterium]
MAGIDTSRRILDKSFTAVGVTSILLMTAALLIILGPIFARGMSAYVFQGTIEHRRFLMDKLHRGDEQILRKEMALADEAKKPRVEMIRTYDKESEGYPVAQRRKAKASLKELKKALSEWLGPLPGDPKPLLMRSLYGQTRWDRAEIKLQDVLQVMEYDYSDPSKAGLKIFVPRVEQFKGTALEPLFDYATKNASRLLQPRWTFYWGFLTDESFDSHFFGGIWPEVLGTLYLTLGAMLFAIPMGIIAAIYLVEYAKQTRLIGLLRSCISTLAGVPSIVFGLFGLAFFINTIHVSHSKSALAGSLTLGLLILPTVIRASEEAIKAVPKTYKQASLSLGASTWQTVVQVILPAALPGILTGVVISMGRAAGETAPIIFTAAVSVGKPLKLWQTFTQPTPALPWNIYNLCSEHEAVDEIRHVQYGMVFTLVVLVLVLNLAAILLRARIMRRLRG